jgi:hypothetical protein
MLLQKLMKRVHKMDNGYSFLNTSSARLFATHDLYSLGLLFPSPLNPTWYPHPTTLGLFSNHLFNQATNKPPLFQIYRHPVSCKVHECFKRGIGTCPWG